MKKTVVLVIILNFIFQIGSSQTINRNNIIRSEVLKNAKSIWDRGSSFTQQNIIFNDIDLSSYELVSANLSFTDKDQTQKVILAPFRLTNNPLKWGMLVNTKFNLSLKDKITTVGVGFGGDNSSPFTKRANRIRKELFIDLQPAGVPNPNIPLSFEQQLINILSSCQVKDSTHRHILDSLGIPNCIDAASLRTLDSIYAEKRLQLIFEEYTKTELAIANKTIDSLLLLYDKRIAMHVFKWTIGYNKQLFPNMFAQGQFNNFDSLNYYNSKSDNISGSITYSYNNNLIVISATYNQIYARSTAVKEQKVVPYYGPSFSASIRLFKFLPQSILDTTSNYKRSLFVPSLNIGLSFEGKYANVSNKYQAFYQDNIKNVVAWTPYIDILISPALQFRIGLPIIRNTFPNAEKQISAGANVQYNFKLSNLVQ